MTNEEARKILDSSFVWQKMVDEECEALGMAIKALEKQNAGHYEYAVFWEKDGIEIRMTVPFMDFELAKERGIKFKEIHGEKSIFLKQRLVMNWETENDE